MILLKRNSAKKILLLATGCWLLALSSNQVRAQQKVNDTLQSHSASKAVLYSAILPEQDRRITKNIGRYQSYMRASQRWSTRLISTRKIIQHLKRHTFNEQMVTRSR